MKTRTRALSMQEDFALKQAERDGFLLDPSRRQMLWPWWMAACRRSKQPFVAGCPKQRYAILEVDLDPCYPREFTEAGGDALTALLRQYSQGVKHWSASGGRYHWLCLKIPQEHIRTVAQETRKALEDWTMVPELAESIW